MTLQIARVLYFILYADDTNLFFSDNDLSRLMNTVNSELLKLAEWFRANKLSLNVKKTHYMIFHQGRVKHMHQNFNIIIDGYKINEVATTKFLGVTIDNKLNWKSHIFELSSKLCKNIGVMYKVRPFVSEGTMMMLYNALILPHLTYCNVVWGCTSKIYIDKLFKLQKRALRIITFSPYRTHTLPLFKKLRILRIMDINSLQLALAMFDVIKDKDSVMHSRLSEHLKITSQIHSYNTRSSSQLCIPAARTNLTLRSFKVMGVKLWNSLSPEIKDSKTKLIFKRLYINSIIDSYI